MRYNGMLGSGVVPMATGGKGALPYMTDLDSTMQQYNSMIGEVKNSVVPELDLNTAGNNARQEAFLRGLDGPLAASVVNTAKGHVINNFANQRHDRLTSLLQQRGQLGQALQMQEYQRRQDAYQRELAKRKNDADLGSTIGTVLGTAGGLAAAILIPGVGWVAAPALMGAGGSLGGMIGGQVPGMFNGGR